MSHRPDGRGPKRAFSPGEPPERPTDPAVRRANLRRVTILFRPYRVRLVAVVVATAVFIAVLRVTGMALGTALFLVVLLRAVEGYPWRLALPVAVGAAALNWAVFTYWLQVPFPVGVLGF